MEENWNGDEGYEGGGRDAETNAKTQSGVQAWAITPFYAVCS